MFAHNFNTPPVFNRLAWFAWAVQRDKVRTFCNFLQSLSPCIRTYKELKKNEYIMYLLETKIQIEQKYFFLA